MIHLILGDIGSGKTCLCEKIAGGLSIRCLSCGGVLAPSYFEGERKIGSYLLDLSTGKTSEFCHHKSVGDVDGEEFCDWVFEESGIEFGLRSIRTGMNKDVVFIDEVGPFELSGGGFAPILAEVFKSDCEVIVVMKRHIKDRFYAAYPGVKTCEHDMSKGDVIIDEIVEEVSSGA